MKILVLIVFAFIIINNAKSQDLDEIQAALSGISDAVKWTKALKDVEDRKPSGVGPKLALGVCIDIYEGSEGRLQQLMVSRKNNISFSWDDTIAWLSSALAGNTACLDGLTETGMSPDTSVAQKLNDLLEKALAKAVKHEGGGGGAVPAPPNPDADGDNLETWTPGKSKADAVVAQDGSGQYKTITEALAAVVKMSRPARTIIYVKSGTYDEQVNIDNSLKYLMFVGDGIGKTIITGNLCPNDTGGFTWKTASLYVVADGFWARDITFRNTAGPAKGQAVALTLGSDKSIMYRCSFEGYQDTLLAWFNRQFYRDCQIHGTMDFLFGSAAAVFQNCDFIVRLPLPGLSNVITANGRNNAMDKTGFVIMGSRVVPDTDFAYEKQDVKTFLGRPWQPCARVLFARTEMDDLVDPEGWTYSHFKPNGSCGMFFGEFRDTGKGAATDGRVHWPGVYQHVKTLAQINRFTVRNFIQGIDWLPESGVPFSPDAFQG